METTQKNYWWGWKSPIGLGIFLITAALALAVFIYTIFNLVGTVEQLAHPADSADGLSAQEMQQLESEQAPVTTGTDASGAGDTTGTAAMGQ